jgi:hypothetical protein
MGKNDGACGALVSEVVAAHLRFASHPRCQSGYAVGGDAGDLLLGATLATTDDK